MVERIARAEEWIEGHERRCEERQVSMGREIRELKDSTRSLTKGAWGLVIAVAGWALLQLYNDIKAPPPAPAPAAIARSGP